MICYKCGNQGQWVCTSCGRPFCIEDGKAVMERIGVCHPCRYVHAQWIGGCMVVGGIICVGVIGILVHALRACVE
jgi:hypothetical protein